MSLACCQTRSGRTTTGDRCRKGMEKSRVQNSSKSLQKILKSEWFKRNCVKRDMYIRAKQRIVYTYTREICSKPRGDLSINRGSKKNVSYAKPMHRERYAKASIETANICVGVTSQMSGIVIQMSAQKSRDGSYANSLIIAHNSRTRVPLKLDMNCQRFQENHINNFSAI